jgi:threonylcarbamoyladenosine tRNA methylthiotransferase MtaB
LKKVAFHTLGCKLNFSETSEIGRHLEEAGFERVPFGIPADVTVIHTCSVTGAADRKTRQAVHRAIKTSPGGFIVAMGCFAQLNPDEIASWPGVDLVLGTSEKFDLVRYLADLEKKDHAEIHSCGIADEQRFFEAHSVSERTRAFLKVQDGCDYPCSYCTIPKARGNSRNPYISIIVEQARELASKGLQEIVLTGVNIGDFGRSTGESFLSLCRELDRVEGILRFRISSIEPNLIPDDLLEFVAGSARFAPHFHIPLQSGCDRILKLMRRRYLRDTFAGRVMRIRELMPGACIGADIIVGFPGETDEYFRDTCDFIGNLPVSYLHVFTYSERPGTPAIELPGKVPERIRNERSHVLHEIGSGLKTGFYRSHLHDIRPVLFEQIHPSGSMTGFTDNYIEISIPPEPASLHQVRPVRLERILPGPVAEGTVILEP